MRFLATGLAAVFVAFSFGGPAAACEGHAAAAISLKDDGQMALAQATAADTASAKKKPSKKRAAARKKPKVEYMRAAPMPPGAK
ncbi:MAG TPA: hypothetical protein VFA57_02795 [Pseudolabrys sp.]|jgi:hypothetical protein|nr:hypothetical protein [Pseudolabrys sp.]